MTAIAELSQMAAEAKSDLQAEGYLAEATRLGIRLMKVIEEIEEQDID